MNIKSEQKITFFLLNIKISVSVVEHLGQTSFTTQYSVTWFSFLTHFHSFQTSLPNPPIPVSISKVSL